VGPPASLARTPDHLRRLRGNTFSGFREQRLRVPGRLGRKGDIGDGFGDFGACASSRPHGPFALADFDHSLVALVGQLRDPVDHLNLASAERLVDLFPGHPHLASALSRRVLPSAFGRMMVGSMRTLTSPSGCGLCKTGGHLICLIGMPFGR